MTELKPKKILYIITKSNYGGAQKYVFELASAAKESGHNVVVAAGGTGAQHALPGSLFKKLETAAIDTHHIKNFQRDMSFWHDIKAFFEIVQLVRKIKPDVLHVTSSKAGGIGALAGRCVRVPTIIFTSHGLTMDETWRPKWQRLLISGGTWLTLSLAHRSIMITTDSCNRARSMPGLKQKVFLIKNGIGQVDFLKRPEARKTLAPTVPQRSFWIGGIGELHPNKNWQAAITAMTTLPASTHLVIIGEGEERSKLEQLIQQHQLTNRVHLLGYVNGAPYLNAFDIFLLPSKKEGLPYVLLEAGLAGLPVVASDLPGIRDIIETGHTGLLVEPTPDLLSTSLSMLVRDEGMRKKFSSALQETVAKEFSIEKMYRDTFAIYNSSNSRG